MAFLVRKIIKRDKLEALKECDKVCDLYADVPTNEFRTNQGTLSTWRIDTLEELENAVLAIAVSSTKISKLDIIVIDTELLDNNNLWYKQTDAGVDLPIPDLQESHYDIVDVTIRKLESCAEVYRTIIMTENDEQEKYIIRFTEGEIKAFLKNAITENRIDKDKATKHIKDVIEKLTVA